MKKILLLMLCMLLACPVVMAEEEKLTDKSGKITYYIREDGTAFITGYDTNSDAEVIIPATIVAENDEELTVTGISSLYFDGAESIRLPYSLNTIEFNTTSDTTCEIYVIPDHPVFATIDGVLFEKPTKTLVCYPMGLKAEEYTVPDGIKAIGGAAFCDNKYLKTINLPETLEYLGINSFTGLNITTIDLPDSLKVIDTCAFSNCFYLSDVTLPDSLTTIGLGAFSATNISYIVIPSSVTNIGNTFTLNTHTVCIDGTEFIFPATTLIVERDSYAAQYAYENGYRYEYIDGEDWLEDKE